MDISPEKHKLLKYPTLAALALATPLVACEQVPERTAGAHMPPPELKTDKPSTPSDAGKTTPKAPEKKECTPQEPQRLGGRFPAPKPKTAAEEEEEQSLGGDVPFEQPN